VLLPGRAQRPDRAPEVGDPPVAVADQVRDPAGGPGASLRSFLLEVPPEVIEAARVDGAGLMRQLRRVIIPIISPGLAATALICFIFAWNEFFLAVNLTTVNGATVPIYLVGFVQPEGPFLARLSAAATLACLPVLLAGWAAQDKLVRAGQAGPRAVHGRGQIGGMARQERRGEDTCAQR